MKEMNWEVLNPPSTNNYEELTQAQCEAYCTADTKCNMINYLVEDGKHKCNMVEYNPEHCFTPGWVCPSYAALRTGTPQKVKDMFDETKSPMNFAGYSNTLITIGTNENCRDDTSQGVSARSIWAASTLWQQ